MIKKTLLLLGVLIVIYSVVFHLLPTSIIRSNFTQRNYIKVENYFYESGAMKPVTIIGSSLSTRIITDSISDFYNLGLIGLSIQDGINVILKKRHFPKLLLVETNFYLKKESDYFLDPLLNPINYSIKKYIPLFRSDKPPISVIGQQFTLFLKKKIRGYSVNTLKHVASKPGDFRQGPFNITKKNYAILPDTVDVLQQLQKLKYKFTALEAAGVKIVFYEMPIHPQLINTPRYRYLNEQFRKTFNETHYTYIPTKNWQFQTTDGIHLNEPESLIFTKYIQKWYQQFSGKMQPSSSKSVEMSKNKF
ncbi:hypothetical protein [Runella sp.]|uniref:hypothetical protein n=1 Tax=Runella sp. TaxID=1960881 RepID=UPI003D0E5EDB